jgi:uncharacterized damage-inducible protein DinB
MATSAAATPTFTPEIAKAVLEMNLGSLEHELAATKAVIAAITDPGFKIDPKARTAIENAWHIAASDVHFLEGIAALSFEHVGQEPAAPATTAEVIKFYDEIVPEALARVRSLTPQQLLTPVNFFNVFNFPAFLYSNFLLNHHIHHRGQLSASLRPMGSKCPSIYGGSADVPFQMPGETAA